ncbi:MAG: murein L,D-transpeptidase [Verrucomicrobia bacterium]|nr:murein L,D-transpeptidase [Verrucomicrobiota bacterium]
MRSLSYWTIALAGLAVLAWVFWEASREPARPARATATAPGNRPSTSVAQPTPPATPASPPPTNLISAPAVPRAPTAAPGVVHPPAVSNVAQVSPPTGPPLFPTNLVLNGRWDGPRPVGTTFEMQLALARRGFSSGSLDGRAGSQTRAALRAFQAQVGLRISGVLDTATRAALSLDPEPVTTYRVTSADLARLRPLSRTWLGKSQQDRLDYETILELVAERSWSHPRLIRELNPRVNWAEVSPGTIVQVPHVIPLSRTKAAELKIELSGKVLRAYDARANLIAFMPCSIAKRVEKRPVGTLRVARVALNPVYTFNPEIFRESPEARRLNRKLDIPPGPNNPVGVAWIGLDKPGYGIHGTPEPEQVGRTESHGCFRLANWNAEYLAGIVSVGIPVNIEP